MVSACLPSPSLRNLLTCPVATSSAEDVGKGKSCFGSAWGFCRLGVLNCHTSSLSAMYECLLRFLNLKIQEGEAHNIFCPAFDCYQQVPVEVIESVVSREMDKRYLQFDIKVVRCATNRCLESSSNNIQIISPPSEVNTASVVKIQCKDFTEYRCQLDNKKWQTGSEHLQ